MIEGSAADSRGHEEVLSGVHVVGLRGELFETAQQLKSDIIKSAALAEDEKRLSDDIVDKMHAEGLYNLWVPTSLGGADVDPLTTLKLLEEIASYDASTAWALMIGIEMNGFISNYAPDSVIRKFFSGEGKAISGGVVMPGGSLEQDGEEYTATGLWPFGSGCQHATWMLGSCILMEDEMPVMGSSGNPELHVAMFPKDMIYINDTWRTLGMKGTGSHHWGVKDQRIGADQVWPITRTALRKNKVLGFPWAVLFALTKASVAMGIAKATVEHYRKWSMSTQPFGSNYFISEDSGTQIEFAKRYALFQSARAFLFGTIRDIWEKVQQGQEIDEDTIALGHLAAVKSSEDAYQVVTDLFYLSGASASIYDKKPLQKLLRDMTTARSHIALSHRLYEASGASLLGGNPVAIMPFWDLNYK
ncbi:acyl-CoA dehydrogenase family protein [Janthinobacterium fluminis]|uniref:Acyl-CoA dehydrogenase family protein n=1 Tax=Janthinobacterium fluminis TaxID=2987524 RepID=A0ABT5K2H7_9BURK|nr:acyl-CoA dehydrogenase family protein [Janthinobacterium fluminis]MDC8758931.1 acyl-CoA dehydrogenase family protein [Janthinobacterium fluminis]